MPVPSSQLLLLKVVLEVHFVVIKDGAGSSFCCYKRWCWKFILLL